MSDKEQRFLAGLREFIGAARGKLALDGLARNVLAALRTLAEAGLKPPKPAALRKATQMLATATSSAKTIRRRAALDPGDLEFLDQVVGTIDFALRNGVGILFVLDVLGHDFVEIERVGSLREAREHGFLPKVVHWAKLTPDAFGEASEEP